MHLHDDKISGAEHHHEHSHEHSHNGVAHTHVHSHVHDHAHQHPHEHESLHGETCAHNHLHNCKSNDCASCSGCTHTPMEELLVLMKYMIGHNAAHARELADLATQLENTGNRAAYEQVMTAVSDFETGNLRLSAVLASLEK